MTVHAQSSAARRRVRSAVTADMNSIAARVIETIRADVDAYRDLRDDQIADVEAIAAWSLNRLLDIWVGDRPVRPMDRARFRSIGAARAGDGRPLASVLRAYRVATAQFIAYVAHSHGAELDVVDIADLSVAVITVLDYLSESITEGHTTARDRITEHSAGARSELLEDLLIGRRSTASALHDRCRELGIALPTYPSLLVVIAVAGADPINHASADDFLTASTGANSTAVSLSTLHEDCAVFLLPPLPRRNLDLACQERRWRGCLIEGAPLTATSRSFRLADEALHAAPEHAYLDRALIDRGDAQVLALLAARSTASPAETVRAVLGPLADAKNKHLFAALAAYTAVGTASGAATRLHLHPQTLRYRLRRCTELTGRDAQHPWHLLTLSVAVELVQLTVGTSRPIP